MKKIQEIEINAFPVPHPDCSLKIDGHLIRYVQDVKIHYGMDERIPIVEIKVLAPRLIAKIKGRPKIKVNYETR